jgi:hypothetical protein
MSEARRLGGVPESIDGPMETVTPLNPLPRFSFGNRRAFFDAGGASGGQPLGVRRSHPRAPRG